MQEIDLLSFKYTDHTGYATHLSLEFEQYLRVGTSRTILNVPMTLKLDGGSKTLQLPGVKQVYSIVAQPYISHHPGEREFLGTPFTLHPSGGSYIRAAEFVTVGAMVPRTLVHKFNACRPNRPTAKTHSSKIRMMEVLGGNITYRDPMGEARWVTWTLTGTNQEGITGVFPLSPVAVPKGGVATPQEDLSGYEDLTRVECQPYRDPGLQMPYGTLATITPSAPSLFLIDVETESVPGNTQPTNEVVSYSEGAPPTSQSGNGPMAIRQVAELNEMMVEPHAGAPAAARAHESAPARTS